MLGPSLLSAADDQAVTATASLVAIAQTKAASSRAIATQTTFAGFHRSDAVALMAATLQGA